MQTNDIFFLFCIKCDKHLAVQNWMRNNHDHKKSIHNPFAMMDALGKDHVRIKSVTVIPETQEQQMTCIVDVKGLKQNEGVDDHREITDVEACVHSILVNRIPIGKEFYPYEVIHVQTEADMFLWL